MENISIGTNSVSLCVAMVLHLQFLFHINHIIMDYPDYTSNHNKGVDGYKIPGDGNAPNAMAKPGNASFDENPHAMTSKNPEDQIGQEFNTGDKAFHDSSAHDFVKTVSSLHHASPEDEDYEQRILMQFKTPDGDR